MIDDIKLNDMFLDADSLISKGQIGEAQRVLEAIIAEDPSFGRAHNHLGWIYETKLRDYENAEQHYRMALTFTPSYCPVYYNYSAVLSTQKRWDDLEKLLTDALKVQEINLATIHNEFGIMYELQGKYDQAITSYKNAVKNSLDIKNVDLYKGSIARCKSKQEIDNL
jgi:Tfp pilus assembly protein PilF